MAHLRQRTLCNWEFWQLGPHNSTDTTNQAYFLSSACPQISNWESLSVSDFVEHAINSPFSSKFVVNARAKDMEMKSYMATDTRNTARSKRRSRKTQDHSAHRRRNNPRNQRIVCKMSPPMILTYEHIQLTLYLSAERRKSQFGLREE